MQERENGEVEEQPVERERDGMAVDDVLSLLETDFWSTSIAVPLAIDHNSSASVPLHSSSTPAGHWAPTTREQPPPHERAAPEEAMESSTSPSVADPSSGKSLPARSSRTRREADILDSAKKHVGVLVRRTLRSARLMPG